MKKTKENFEIDHLQVKLIFSLFNSGSGSSRLDSQPLSSGSGASQDLQHWHWRDEFKSHTSKISMALSESLKQACKKALDEEMQSYKSSKRIPTVKLKGLIDIFFYYQCACVFQNEKTFGKEQNHC